MRHNVMSRFSYFNLYEPRPTRIKYSEYFPLPTACFEIKLGLFFKKEKSDALNGSLILPLLTKSLICCTKLLYLIVKFF
jgi:hypothetical protein